MNTCHKAENIIVIVSYILGSVISHEWPSQMCARRRCIICSSLQFVLMWAQKQFRRLVINPYCTISCFWTLHISSYNGVSFSSLHIRAHREVPRAAPAASCKLRDLYITEMGNNHRLENIVPRNFPSIPTRLHSPIEMIAPNSSNNIEMIIYADVNVISCYLMLLDCSSLILLELYLK